MSCGCFCAIVLFLRVCFGFYVCILIFGRSKRFCILVVLKLLSWMAWCG